MKNESGRDNLEMLYTSFPVLTKSTPKIINFVCFVKFEHINLILCYDVAASAYIYRHDQSRQIWFLVMDF